MLALICLLVGLLLPVAAWPLPWWCSLAFSLGWAFVLLAVWRPRAAGLLVFGCLWAIGWNMSVQPASQSWQRTETLRLLERHQTGWLIAAPEGWILAKSTKAPGLLPGQWFTASVSCRPAILSPALLADRITANCTLQGIRNGRLPRSTAWLNVVRNGLTHQLAVFLPSPVRDLTAGFFLGNQTVNNAALKRDLQATGTTHLIAVSGYNFLIVVSVMALLLQLFLAPRPATLALIPIMLAYGAMAGLSGAVWRALLFVLLILLARLLYRRPPGWWLLLLTLTVATLWNPWILRTDLSFQLSAAASFGVIVLAPKVEALLKRVIRFRLRLIKLLTAQLAETLGATIAVTPLLTYYFGQQSWLAVPVNLLVVPLVPYAMVATSAGLILSLLLPLWPGAPHAVAWPLPALMLGVIHLAAHL